MDRPRILKQIAEDAAKVLIDKRAEILYATNGTGVHREVENMAVTLETITPPQSGPLNIEIKLTANIQVTPETARRRVGVFVGNEIADLLHGDTPDLVLREDGVYWRVPVVLSSRSLGRIGQVGVIDVDVETGDLKVNDQIISEIEARAQRFAAVTAL
jgi:hypothetical protein